MVKYLRYVFYAPEGDVKMAYKNVVVYCGSRAGNNPSYAALAGRLGEALGKNGFHLIYGGGTVGLMGILADALTAGGHVTGIIPEVFIEKEQAHRGLTELIEVPDMTTRKKRLMESGDAFLVLPGGIGTLEELADTLSHYRIYWTPGNRPPILIMNPDGIYDPLKELMANWMARGFAGREDLSSIRFCKTVEEVIAIIKPRKL